jgi:hypothetical protein
LMTTILTGSGAGNCDGRHSRAASRMAELPSSALIQPRSKASRHHEHHYQSR